MTRPLTYGEARSNLFKVGAKVEDLTAHKQLDEVLGAIAHWEITATEMSRRIAALHDRIDELEAQHAPTDFDSVLASNILQRMDLMSEALARLGALVES